MLYLNEEFQRHWSGSDPFEVVGTLQGTVYRDVKNRKTFQFEIAGHSYFAKLHLGVGWLEIIKNLLQLKMPILGAENEWRAISKLEELGLATMEYVAYGSQGLNPAARRSFIVTKDLVNTTSLEDYCKPWSSEKPSFNEKRYLIEEIAKISRTLHGNGVCHRDFYLCHFLRHSTEHTGEQAPKLSLIDLHRALIMNNLSKRWIIKDVAGLYFSAMDIGLTKRDLLRFIKHYDNGNLRESLVSRRKFWIAIDTKAKAMYKKLGSAS